MTFCAARDFPSLATLVIVGFVLAINFGLGVEAQNLEVTVPQGKLRGVSRKTYFGRNVASFLGIPFAEPPIGNLRFKPPLKAKPWKGTFAATRDGATCPQFNSILPLSGQKGNENCLFLNVFTPSLPTANQSRSLPVMVYLFGGVNLFGSAASATYSPKYLLDEDMLLVVPNYRLGVLGFLSTGDEVVPGNAALKDIVLALKWVQENIEYFGGDPNSVTLVGHSSGAAAAQILALSQSTKGLFHRYICQSGTATALWTYSSRSTARQRAFDLGKHFKCSTKNSTALVDCLRKLPATRLVGYNFLSPLLDYYPFLYWRPTDEDDTEDAIITDSPENLIASGKLQDLPWIVGVVRDEATLLPACYRYFKDKFDDKIAAILNLVAGIVKMPYTQANFTEYIEEITGDTGIRSDVNATQYAFEMAAYLKETIVDMDASVDELALAVGDILVLYPTWISMQLQSEHATSPMYVYSFNYRGTYSYPQQFCGPKTYGVAHGDELTYLFDKSSTTYKSLNLKLSSSDFKMIRNMVQMWTSFATYGTPLTSSQTGTTVWKPYTSSEPNVLYIGDDQSTHLTLRQLFYDNRIKFWTELATKRTGIFRYIEKSANGFFTGGGIMQPLSFMLPTSPIMTL